MTIHPPLCAVFFDFDGVILESVAVKTRAFQTLFSAYPDHWPTIQRYHLDNGGLSRFEKFKVIYRAILKQQLSAEELARLGERFNQLVLDEVIAAPYVRGARELLERLHRALPLFVISGTPHDELTRIVDARELQRFFWGVYGSPPGKAETLRALLGEYGWRPGDGVFIGDSTNDLDAAQEVRMPFIGRAPAGEDNPFVGAPEIPVVVDMIDLADGWEQAVKMARDGIRT